MPSSHNPANDTPDLRTPASSPQPEPPRRSVLLHLHRPRRSVEAFEVFDDDARIRDIITVADDLIFLDDDDEPIDVNLTLAQVIGGRGRHHHHYDIHRHPCRWINAYISYGDGTQTLQAAPSSRIATVRLRALDLFGIDPDTATNLVLRIPATDADLPESEYLSNQAGPKPCRIDLTLVPSS